MSVLVDSIISSHNLDTGVGTLELVKALAWARVSTDMQEEKGLSMPEQLREIRVYAEKHGFEIVEEYHEAASAFQKKTRRIEFERMIDRAKQDKGISVILVHDLSRFSRDSIDAQVLIRDLGSAGVRVVSLSDPNIDRESVAGVYMEHILLAKNEAYSREIAFHTKKGCRANIQTRDPETGWCYKNGGQPLWGYRSERLIRGEIKKGRPLIKSIWVPDDKEVSGKRIYEWARYSLIEMAAKGATLDELRDFCNRNGIPAPRQEYWGHTTWNSLLHPHCLLEYAGYGVWNVRGKNQRYNPPSEWVIVENAHQALITEDEAKQIMAARAGRSFTQSIKTSNRAHNSPYVLSGGTFRCGRCGGNMVGFYKNRNDGYYVCNSVPNRRGLGCGQGVYVAQREIEKEVFDGLERLLGVCTDEKGFVRQINSELSRIWEESLGYDPGASQRLGEIEGKIANIRRSIEDGLVDTSWANARLGALIKEQQSLSATTVVQKKAPHIDLQAAMAYRRDSTRMMASGTNAEKKRMLSVWVDKIELAPETLDVEIRYKIPEPVVDSMGAGIGFEPMTFGL